MSDIAIVGKSIVNVLKDYVYDDPNARLLFAVWSRAVQDAYISTHLTHCWSYKCSSHDWTPAGRTAVEAIRWLASDAGRGCLKLSGVDPDFADRIIRNRHAFYFPVIR